LARLKTVVIDRAEDRVTPDYGEIEY